MSLVLAQINTEWLDTAPRDVVVNTLHFANGTPDPLADTDYGNIAQVVADAFHLYYARVDDIGGTNQTKRGFQVKVYELDDPSTPTEPRRPRSSHVIAATGPESDNLLGPRQIASCLSFYSTANNPRTRGRVYLGPFTAGKLSTPRVPAAISGANLAALVVSIGSAGGEGVDWVTFSTRGAGHHTVSHFWMDDRWDVIRKRAAAATTRTTGTTGG